MVRVKKITAKYNLDSYLYIKIYNLHSSTTFINYNPFCNVNFTCS